VSTDTARYLCSSPNRAQLLWAIRIVALPALIAACQDPLYGVPLGDVGLAVDHPTYTAHIAPLWGVSCGIGCHTGGDNAGDLALDAGYFALIEATSDQAPLALISPEAPAESYLWLKLEGTHEEAGGAGAPMPLTGVLSETHKESIFNWIMDGAPE